MESNNLIEFLYPHQKSTPPKPNEENKKETMMIDSAHDFSDEVKVSLKQPKTASHTAQKSYNESNHHYESTQDR
jgi:hypothetical protein